MGGSPPRRRTRARTAIIALVLGGALAASPMLAGALLPPPAPQLAEGFTLAPLAPLAAPTAIMFGPGAADGPDLYATTLAPGNVWRINLVWTPAGTPIAKDIEVFADGFSSPLGLAFGPAGAMYVADSHPGVESGQTDGRVTHVLNGVRTVIVDGLPQGQHNVNHLRFGPDGRLYMPNGNPNDHGNGTGTGHLDLFPYSGAILSVDVDEVLSSPAVLHYEDENGDPIPFDDIPDHPINADFADKVDVYAYGFRNIFGVAFSPAGDLYTAMNGADDPSSQDVLYKVRPDHHHGYPFCYNVGVPGDVGTGVSVLKADNTPNPAFPCTDREPATALLGWHTCATGIDFPTQGTWGFSDNALGAWKGSVYVGECAFFFPEPDKLAEHPEALPHSTSHKIVRVELDANGDATAVYDFVTGTALVTDVLFGPEGALYFADAEGIFRVAPVAPSLGGT